MPAMDIDFGNSQRSPPMAIASPRTVAHDALPLEDPAQMPIPKLNHDAIREKARKRKKNKKKGMPPAAPAVNVIKGFQTPGTSCGDESDVSMLNTPRIGATRMGDMSSAMNSPALRPATPSGGISALRARLDALALEQDDGKTNLTRTMTASSVCSMAPSSRAGSDGDRTEMETYDVPLDQDFVSSEAGARTPLFASQAIEGGLRSNSIHRKMCAEDFEQMRCLGKGAFGGSFLSSSDVCDTC